MKTYTLFFTFCTSLTLLTLAACNGSSQSTSSSSRVQTQPELDQAQIQARLRSRVEAWYTPTNRGGVVGGQCATSCHSTVPFMMSNSFKHLDDRITADGYANIIGNRIQNWATLKPFYSWAPSQSWSTEALINAATRLEYDRKTSNTLSDLSCQALKNLWPLQQADGSFLWLDASLSPWEDNYAPYYAASMLAVSLGLTTAQISQNNTPVTCEAWGQQTANVAKLYGYLKTEFTNANKHGQAWALWANTATKNAIFSVQEHQDALLTLTKLQRSDGGFDLKDFGPFARQNTSPAMSQPYPTKLIINAIGRNPSTAFGPILTNAKRFMADFTPRQIDDLKSLNDPEDSFNNALFQDANLAFYLSNDE